MTQKLNQQAQRLRIQCKMLFVHQHPEPLVGLLALGLNFPLCKMGAGGIAEF